MSLKAKLTLAISGVVVVATAVLGVTIVRVVETSLIDQTDQRLEDIASRPPPGRLGAGQQQSDDVTYQPIADLYYDADGVLVDVRPSGFTDEPEPLPDLPQVADRELLLDTPTTVAAADGSFDYRVVAVELPDGGIRVAAESLTDEQATVDRLVQFAIITGAAVVVAAALISWLVIRRSLRPVDRMISTASAIGGGDLSRRIDHPEDDTELGRLARALDDMLAQLDTAFAERQESEQRLRRFAADASHELRTPVAAIRGYAELYQQGGIPQGEALDRAIDRIASESTRMGSLVEDLLLLARLDQRQPVEWTTVDVAEQARDAAADLQAVEPTRPVSVDAPGPALVRGDEPRLRQVVTNLLANARAHTPPDTPVHISVTAGRDEVVLAVADEGPGIDPALSERVFERFYRGNRSRQVGEGGAGLGLSIVASVVAAHGGRVDLESQPGTGATFTVHLPTDDRAG